MTNRKEEVLNLVPREIERKFLVRELPKSLDQYPHSEIIQGYLAITEDTEVRLRQKGKIYYETVKNGKGENRPEREIVISQRQFKKLWGATEGRRIRKTRYEIPDGDGKLELDIYHDSLEGFISIEREFKSETESGQFKIPEWFGREVTEDKSYKNQSLAVWGLPDEEKRKIANRRVSLIN